MRCAPSLAMILMVGGLCACASQEPAPPRASPSSPRLAEALAPLAAPAESAASAAAPSAAATPGRALREGAGPLPPQAAPPSSQVTGAPEATGSPACQEARAWRADVSAHLAAVRQTAGVAEAKALDRASAALAACEAREDCVEGDPKLRAERVMAVEEARAALRKAHAGLQQEELALYEADRSVQAACGATP